ncbi:Rne/Rng family ribonuclease [Peribacillus saganii]|uniref:Rne/Rng family ribonuclease n=1 Tax=Peribacillus saganii TaxID=2303992 RepID=A0A372LTT4_9BACI|nr:Rne/Rng family ribonuclease [Peribacillus saganii]RFU71588.1 Rne/Rng family ribonuclease [Peribacillus saganii]
MKKIIINMIGREKRYAVIEDGELVKLELLPPQQASAVGNIYTGQVTKVLPGMDAAFIDYGAEKNGFLHRDQLPSFQRAKRAGNLSGNEKINQFIRQGEKLLIQVVRDGSGNKGARLTGIIELSSDNLVYMHGIDYVGVSKKFSDPAKQEKWRKRAASHKEDDEGLIVRTSMENQPETAMIKTIEELRAEFKVIEQALRMEKRPGLVKAADTLMESIKSEISTANWGEVVLDDSAGYRQLGKWLENHGSDWQILLHKGPENIFTAYKLQNQIEQAGKKIVWLEHGSYLIIEETEAFTVIDVNTGKFTGKREKEATLTETNRNAAKEIAKQLRLRNIGGIILVDFINMKDEADKRSVISILKEESKKDEMRVQIGSFSSLGILEMTRKKTTPSLSERMNVSCPVCKGSGKVESSESLAFRLERELLEHKQTDGEAVWIEAPQSIIDVLSGDKDSFLPTLEEAIAKKLLFSVMPENINTYRIRHFGSIEEITERQKKSI